jgi:peptidoglycan/xylan/chitin deacetylase (PgdA/CDA1 family)
MMVVVKTPRVRPLVARGLGTGLVLIYHRVTELRADPFAMAVTPRQFEEHLEVLAARHRVVPLHELANGFRRRRRGARPVAITFDDGYADNLHAALPRLEARGLPAAFFIATGYVDAGRAFWWDELEQLVVCGSNPTEALELGPLGARRRWPMTTDDERMTALLELQYMFRRTTASEIEGRLDRVRRWRGDEPVPRDSHAVMTSTELSRLASSELAEVGAHSRRHANLANATQEDQWDEIAGSRRDLLQWLGAAPTIFSYPFGRMGADFSAATIRVARRAGYRWGVARSDAVLTPLTSAMRLPRRTAPAVGGDRFERWLDHQLRR